MTWDWVGTLVVGVAGIIATYMAGARQQKTALAVVRQQIDAQVAVAREERQQKRFEEAYLELLSALTLVHYWVFTVYPPMTNKPEGYTMQPLPELPDSAQKEALWTAYWSPRVEQLMKEWESTVRQLQSAGMEISLGLRTEKSGQRSSIDLQSLQLHLPALKEKVIQADRRIREQVRLELLGKHEGHAEEAVTNAQPAAKPST
jgi:hypothetical protein